MRHAARGPRGRSFTLAVCGSCDRATGQVMDGLRRAARGCPHGVMVSTDRLGKLLHCRRHRGVHAAVQPCAVDRRPAGAVVRPGPLETEADAHAVRAWPRGGMSDDGTLPDRLRAAPFLRRRISAPRLPAGGDGRRRHHVLDAGAFRVRPLAQGEGHDLRHGEGCGHVLLSFVPGGPAVGVAPGEFDGVLHSANPVSAAIRPARRSTTSESTGRLRPPSRHIR